MTDSRAALEERASELFPSKDWFGTPQEVASEIADFVEQESSSLKLLLSAIQKGAVKTGTGEGNVPMTEIAKNTLEVGTNGSGEVVVNHPDLQPDENGVGHIVFSPDQARHLAFLLQNKAHAAEEEIVEKKRQEAEKIPVDRSAQILTSGAPVPEDRGHTKLRADGQQEGYVVLSPEERSKGFVRPYRDAYRHLKCGTITTMSRSISETYARDPGFYTGTFCTTCAAHFPIGEEGEFVWYEMDGTTGPKVGT